MFLKQQSFNHESSNFREALNVPMNVMINAVEKIIFSTVSNALAATELYEDSDEAPREVSTVTGDLQKCLQLANEGLEYEVVLLLFRHYHELAQTAIKHYHLVNIKEKHESQDRAIKLISKLLMIKETLDEEDDDQDRSSINLPNMLKRINFVKKSNYNFEKYMKYVNDYNTETYLNKLLGGDDDLS